MYLVKQKQDKNNNNHTMWVYVRICT